MPITGFSFFHFSFRFYHISYSYILFILVFGISADARAGFDNRGSVPAIDTDDYWPKLLQQAGTIALQPPVTIISKPESPWPADHRTYVSLACYWWPDPGKKNGLPYVRRDGMINPETRSARSDLPKLIEMTRRIEILAAAYHRSGNEAFATSATDQLRIWFTDPKTAMLPHLEHAQVVKGRDKGRSYGVIDTWRLVRVVASFDLLRPSPHWNRALEQGLKAWFTHYLNWLLHSEHGRAEKNRSNNHGTWYDVQVVSYALFTGREVFAKVYLETVTLPRIRQQISSTGEQPYESRRPRPLHYAIFNLRGWMHLAGYGRTLGVDLINRRFFLNPGLQGALFSVLHNVRKKGLKPAPTPLDPTDTSRLYHAVMREAWQLTQKPVFYREGARKCRNKMILF